MPRFVLGAFATLPIVLLGGWLCSGAGHSGRDRAREVSELRNVLLEAHASLLAARADLYERNFHSASRQLEDARSLLRLAEAQGKRLGLLDEVAGLDLAGFEAGIDEAHRLLGQLDDGGHALEFLGRSVFEKCPEGPARLRHLGDAGLLAADTTRSSGCA